MSVFRFIPSVDNGKWNQYKTNMKEVENLQLQKANESEKEGNMYKTLAKWEIIENKIKRKEAKSRRINGRVPEKDVHK